MGQGENAPVSRTRWAGLTTKIGMESESAARGEEGGVMSRIKSSFLNDLLIVLQGKNITANVRDLSKHQCEVKGPMG